MKDIYFLLIDEGSYYKHGPYIEKFKLFDDLESCLKEAKKRGWNSCMKIDINPGIMNTMWEGDRKLSILVIENNSDIKAKNKIKNIKTNDAKEKLEILLDPPIKMYENKNS